MCETRSTAPRSAPTRIEIILNESIIVERQDRALTLPWTRASSRRRREIIQGVGEAQGPLRGLSRELGSGRTRVEGLGSCSGRSRRPPILKRFASESAERIAGNEMALDVERVLDCGMNGQEPLC